MSQISPNLNPNLTPFIDAYKSTLLTQAAIYGLPIEEKISLSQLHVIIESHEIEQIELSQRTIEPCNDNHIGEYEKYIIEKAMAYHIPVVINNLDVTKLCLEVDDYEWLLDQASNRYIDWDTSTYDPNGLQQAIDDSDHNEAEDYRNYVLSVRSVYQYSRGV